MISRSLTRRVEYLEQLAYHFRPVGEPMIMTVQFVDKYLRVVDQMQLTLAPWCEWMCRCPKWMDSKPLP
jgi:hypothetical protein